MFKCTKCGAIVLTKKELFPNGENIWLCKVCYCGSDYEQDDIDVEIDDVISQFEDD